VNIYIANVLHVVIACLVLILVYICRN